MTIHNIQVFCAVCEERTMSRAATRLHMTQPGVSKIISDMEKNYATVFFIRKNKQVFLTAQGKQFYEDSRIVLQDFARLENNVQHSKKAHSIVLGCTSGIGFSMISDVETKFHQRYPHCRLRMRDSSSSKIQKLVIDGECNIAMVQHSTDDERLHQESFCRNSLVAVCAPGYQLRSNSRELTIQDLANENLILLEKERTTRALIDNIAMENGYILDPKWTSSSPSNVKELAARGEGVAILFEIQVRKEVENGRLAVIPTTLNTTTNFYIIYRKDIWLSEEEQYLLQLCREYAP
ncbi:MAG: LysR family transcriptional regulator [Spirochaetales bacterium]|nr:LysR family transcriptional regulator [Spirochaetales bacterium]